MTQQGGAKTQYATDGRLPRPTRGDNNCRATGEELGTGILSSVLNPRKLDDGATERDVPKVDCSEWKDQRDSRLYVPERIFVGEQ